MLSRLMKQANIGNEQESLDYESQIKEGVKKFAQTQDPDIAVEVVNMLAGVMGISPELGDPSEDIDMNQEVAPELSEATYMGDQA